MEFLVEKIGMSRTVAKPSIPVILLKVKNAKVCEVLAGVKAIVDYQKGKSINISIAGQYK